LNNLSNLRSILSTFLKKIIGQTAQIFMYFLLFIRAIYTFIFSPYTLWMYVFFTKALTFM